MLSKSIISVLIILFYVQNTLANCLLNSAIFSSEDGKDKFIVDKVAYKREHSCWFENKNGYDFDSSDDDDDDDWGDDDWED